MRAILVLEDGSTFKGTSFGATGEVDGEAVFNTSMTGYQEILTDPSYCGQMVTMTYPLIGNYGINPDDAESEKPQVRALIVREYCKRPSNHLSTMDISSYLKEHNVIGLSGIDTRRLTRHIRLKGAMKGIISTIDDDADSLHEKVKNAPAMVGRDLVREVTCKEQHDWTKGFESRFSPPSPDNSESNFSVVAIDFGVKHNILRYLVEAGCKVTVVPAGTSAEDVLSLKPDGVFLSNGPGDPEPITYAVDTIRGLLGKVPVFGICLGHQLLGLALGGKTYKLKFGHRGGNQPVKNLATGRVEITSQNHGFALDVDSLPQGEVEVTHINLNDQTNEGIRHKTLPAFSVQYHPEASPGPHDASYLFDDFTRLMQESR